MLLSVYHFIIYIIIPILNNYISISMSTNQIQYPAFLSDGADEQTHHNPYSDPKRQLRQY